MNLIQITPGAGGMYCGNCFRDNALVAELRRQGHDTVMMPLYLPMTLDEAPTAGDTPTFFGGINVFLSQKSAAHRRAPSWLRRLLDSPALLRWAAGKTAKTRAGDVGELTVSMLRGEHGHQARELEEMVGWMRNLPKPDAVFLSNALLVGFTRRLRTALGTRVVCHLQSEESFLDGLPEPHRSDAWRTLAERARDVDGWIAPTRYFSGRMVSRLGLDPGRVAVATTGISLEGYRDLPSPRPRREGPAVLGFFARMCPEKGLDTVVDAFIALRAAGSVPGLRLAIGGACGPGDRPFVEGLRAKLAAAGLAADVTWRENLSRADKIAFLGSVDALSVPARFSEAFGLYMIEAMAAGTPVIQPDACGFREVVTATGGGVIYPVNDADGLARAAAELLSEPDHCRRLGEAGRVAVFAGHDDAAMARSVAEQTRRFLA